MDKAPIFDGGADISTEYTELLNREGLKYSSKLIKLMTFMSYAAVQKLISPEMKAEFMVCKQHKKYPHRHMQYCADEVSGVCTNGYPKLDLISMALCLLCNVFVNNYRKI